NFCASAGASVALSSGRHRDRQTRPRLVLDRKAYVDFVATAVETARAPWIEARAVGTAEPEVRLSADAHKEIVAPEILDVRRDQDALIDWVDRDGTKGHHRAA